MSTPPVPSSGSGARTLSAGDLEATFLPGRGMLGASLRHRGAEILRRVEDLDAAAAKGSTAGIPPLHPWANRLAGFSYHAAGRDVTLDLSSPLLHLDGQGLPIHGVPWARLSWDVAEEAPDRLVARLDWSRPDLLAVFPFPHRLEMAATLGRAGLTLETSLFAGVDGPVPVAFGFHPYVGLPGSGPRRLASPCRRCGGSCSTGRGSPPAMKSPSTHSTPRSDSAAFDDTSRPRGGERPSDFPEAGGSYYGPVARGLPVHPGLRAGGPGPHRARADDRADERAGERPGSLDRGARRPVPGGISDLGRGRRCLHVGPKTPFRGARLRAPTAGNGVVGGCEKEPR